MKGLGDLVRLLERIDGRGYGGYKEIRGSWFAPDAELCIDHVQGDPFATPSRVRIRITADVHELPEDLRAPGPRRIGLCDYLLRVFASAARTAGARSGSGRSGEVHVDAGDAEILERSGCGFDGDVLELRFRVGLPARGRTVLGRAASQLLTRDLLAAAARVRWSALDQAQARRYVEAAEDHDHLQRQLDARGLVAFVANGSILPRQTGVSSRPMANAVPFRSPPELEVTLDTLHRGSVVGMGVPAGVTLVTGGGFHGKTTLLEAIQHGVYPHIPGDGRELVVARRDAVKVRSEDGRSVAAVDLSPFIHDLPGGRDTARFSTPDASGSTSLAAAIVEALEVGARVLLLDEDTSATNLLVRDARMQALVQRETIFPLIDRVRELHANLGVSTVIVIGGSGDWLEVADTVVLMDAFVPLEVSARAREIVASTPTGRATARELPPIRISPRTPRVQSLDPDRRARGRAKVRARGLRELRYGEDTIDLSALEQLVDDSQARAIGVLLHWLGRHGVAGRTLAEHLDDVLEVAARRGLYDLEPLPELAAVRRFELAGALNRLRCLEIGNDGSVGAVRGDSR